MAVFGRIVAYTWIAVVLAGLLYLVIDSVRMRLHKHPVDTPWRFISNDHSNYFNGNGQFVPFEWDSTQLTRRQS